VVVNVFLTSAMVLNPFAEGAESRSMILLREPHKKNLPQVNCHVLFHYTNEVCFTKC